MVGGLMTHNGFLVSEGGFIDDGAAAQIYVQAADVGVKDFVLPATRSDFSWSIFSALKNRGHQPIFYSPGIGAQGGKWSDLCRADGPDWHAIAGRSLLANKLYGPNTQALLKEIPA
jgi:orotidine-5'-phosphate decarboxylase